MQVTMRGVLRRSRELRKKVGRVILHNSSAMYSGQAWWWRRVYICIIFVFLALLLLQLGLWWLDGFAKSHEKPWEFPRRHYKALKRLLGDNPQAQQPESLIVIEKGDLKEAACKETVQAPAWLWDLKDLESEGKSMCVINDIRLALKDVEGDTAASRLKSYAQRRLPHPLDHSGNPIAEISEVESGPFLLVVPNGRIVGTGLVLDDENLYRLNYWYLSIPSAPAQTVVNRPQIVSFLMLYNGIWQHFMFDSLPKIDFMFDWIEAHPSVSILVEAGAPLAFLKQLFPKHEIIEHKSNVMYITETAYFPSFYPGAPRLGFAGFPPVSSEMRRRLIGEDRKISKEEATHIVYLKRSHGMRRNVRNELGLLLAIEGNLKPSYQLKVVTFQAKTREEDKKEMKKAAVVMGPHGGAFSNLFYCSIESVHPIHVIEFVQMREAYRSYPNNSEYFANNGQYANNNYYGFASWLGMRYWLVEPSFYQHEGFNMVVPVEHVLNILDSIGVLKPREEWVLPTPAMIEELKKDPKIKQEYPSPLHKIQLDK